MEKNKKDYLIFTLGFQFIICAIIFGVFFGLKYTNSGLLKTFKTGFFDKLNQNFIVDEIEEKSVSVNKSETKEVLTEDSNQKAEASTEAITDDKLTAEVKAEGGADVSIDSSNEIPSNVSVNTYTLSQNMVLPVVGDTSSEFGARIHPIDGDLRFHAGIDIAAATGTPVYAAFDGEVIKATYDQWNGYHIKIQHDNDIMTVYCHCDELNVKKGEIVRAGEVIGRVGSTGSSTGPHLHFELRINDVSYDPQCALDEAISAV